MFNPDRVQDFQIVDIDNDIAVVGGETGAKLWPAAQPGNLPADIALRHGDDFHRYGEAAEGIDELGFVNNADEFAACRGDDFLACQCAAAALGQLPVAGGLIGAIDIDRHLINAVEIDDGNVVLAQAFFRGL